MAIASSIYSHFQLVLSKQSAQFLLFLHKHFKILVYYSDREQDTCTRANSTYTETKYGSVALIRSKQPTKEIGKYRQSSNAEPSKSSSCGDVPIKFMYHRLLPVATHDHLLFL